MYRLYQQAAHAKQKLDLKIIVPSKKVINKLDYKKTYYALYFSPKNITE